VLRVQPAGGIGDDIVDLLRLRRLKRIEKHSGRIGIRLLFDDRHVGAIGPDFELLDGSRAESICSAQHHFLIIGLKAMSQLADRRRFAYSVNSYHQDHKWFALGNLLRWGVIYTQNFAQFFFDRTAQLFGVLEHFSRHPILNRSQNVIRGGDADIGSNHDGFELFEHARVDFFLAFDEILNLLREVLLRLFDSLFDLFEYSRLFLFWRSE